MKSIFDEYGDTILQILGGISALGIIIELIRPGGVLRELIMQIANSAIG